MSELNQRPKITVEELVRLKRAERPDAAFWANFERELRQKQLTALIEKRPWWQGIPQLLSRRAYLPLGAAAFLGFTLISVRELSPGSTVANANRATSPAPRTERAPVTEGAAPVVASVASPAVNVSDLSEHMTVNLVAASEVPAIATLAVAAVEPQVAPAAPRDDTDSPSARSIAANLARLEQSEPELINAVMGSRLSSPVRAQTAALEEAEPAAGTTSRRSRLLAQYHERMVSPDPSVAPDLVRERLARRLGDSDIYERISRLGLSGSKVSLKF